MRDEVGVSPFGTRQKFDRSMPTAVPSGVKRLPEGMSLLRATAMMFVRDELAMSAPGYVLSFATWIRTPRPASSDPWKKMLDVAFRTGADQVADMVRQIGLAWYGTTTVHRQELAHGAERGNAKAVAHDQMIPPSISCKVRRLLECVYSRLHPPRMIRAMAALHSMADVREDRHDEQRRLLGNVRACAMPQQLFDHGHLRC
eukprot:7068113-Prymnesium_polylepis.1